MKTLEEVTYEAGRHALGDQEALVAGIRQRAGTLLAAHALVASFLGGTAIRHAKGLAGFGYVGLGALVLGLVAAALVLSPWRLKFAVSPRELYARLYDEAALEASREPSRGWPPPGTDMRICASRTAAASA